MNESVKSPIIFLRSGHQDEVSARSLSLCCDLLTTVCQTAIRFCDDALESHLQVIVGTLTAQVTEQPTISQQVSCHSYYLSALCYCCAKHRIQGLCLDISRFVKEQKE